MKPFPNKPFLLSALFILFSSSSSARDIITPSTPLADNEALISSDGSFALGFFTPPDSNNRYVGLWYNLISDHTILWVANRENPVVNSTGLLSITKDGQLNIRDQASFVVWSTNTTKGLTSPIAQLLDSGNLVVKQSGGTRENYTWQGFDFLTDTLIPGMRLGVDLATGINRTLTAWKSYNDPSPSTYNAYMDIKGDPELYFYKGPNVIWRSGAWDGKHLSGVPDMNTSAGLTVNFANNASEVTASFSVNNRALVTRLLLNSSGIIQRAFWLWDNNQWNFFWTAPKDLCDNFGECGAYGLCDSNNSPVCSCLNGFVPKNLQDWKLRDGRDGCIRKTKLDCKNWTDGFMLVSNVKLPQSENSVVNMSLNLGQCRDLCLKNCLCTGYASANISGAGSGCVIWIGWLFDIRNYVARGQDLYVRLAAADLPIQPFVDNLNKRRHTRIEVTVSLVSLVLGLLLLSCIIYFLWKKKKTIREGNWNEDEDLELPLYGMSTIIAATDNFSTENKLGEGGFGLVYKGKLPWGQEIAVKRLSKTSKQGVDEFKNEVLLIAKLQHRNLVRLLGYCIQGEDRMLIYEYMPNKSLDAFLFDKAESINLGWRMRFNIIIGIARGLLYLHQDSRFRIIHRDLKASNVLLDEEMNPKISDFGLARLFGADEATARTRRVVGTYGYMSPEYAMDGIFSVKSDAFSFGVLVLEIVSGQRTKAVFLSEPEDNLLRKAWRLWSEDRGLELIDPATGSDYSIDEVIRCIKVGLLCVQENPKARPNMSSVVHMLSDHEGASMFEPQQPGFMARSNLYFPSPSSTNQDSSSINDITNSLMDVGR